MRLLCDAFDVFKDHEFGLVGLDVLENSVQSLPRTAGTVVYVRFVLVQSGERFTRKNRQKDAKVAGDQSPVLLPIAPVPCLAHLLNVVEQATVLEACLQAIDLNRFDRFA